METAFVSGLSAISTPIQPWRLGAKSCSVRTTTAANTIRMSVDGSETAHPQTRMRKRDRVIKLAKHVSQALFGYGLGSSVMTPSQGPLLRSLAAAVVTSPSQPSISAPVIDTVISTANTMTPPGAIPLDTLGGVLRKLAIQLRPYTTNILAFSVTCLLLGVIYEILEQKKADEEQAKLDTEFKLVEQGFLPGTVIYDSQMAPISSSSTLVQPEEWASKSVSEIFDGLKIKYNDKIDSEMPAPEVLAAAETMEIKMMYPSTTVVVEEKAKVEEKPKAVTPVLREEPVPKRRSYMALHWPEEDKHKRKSKAGKDGLGDGKAAKQ
eukprot:CAMPEP_0184692204 /NCGR_PEP_ID=MMETSP0313-20130426/778_1 /TAXON_ID=2792 /ORGANISM="Porphyridium aerugineum, Strain SAG 1380-2" /LENGTH=321 /DNA_ID=CAMNT_0027150017 /DNA_START=79 /DNA_END=1044 /DNA_ORIENTATION=-